MPVSVSVLLLLAMATLGFALGYRRAWAVGGGSRRRLHSLPSYHGLWVLLSVLLPSTSFVFVGLALKGSIVDVIVWESLPASLTANIDRSLALSRIQGIAMGEAMFVDVKAAEREAADLLLRANTLADWILGLGAIALALGSGAYALPRVTMKFRARNVSERIILAVFVLCSLIAILVTLGIIFSLISEVLRFFAFVSPVDFLFGLTWSPQTAIREGQLGASGAFGAVPVFAGTFLISAIAMAVAIPIGLLSAIYMVEFAQPKLRAAAKPVIEILAGIPTVVYGFFAAVTVAPFVRDVGASLGLDVASESAFAAGSVMGIMIIPFVSSLSDDVISTVPHKLRDAAYSLGATHGETIFRVVLPAALPGLLSAIVLAVSRAIGETMIVVMAAGLFANLTANPFDAVTTVTVQITSVLTGDQPFDSPTTLSAFALGLTLFAVTLALNMFALKVMQRYREKYD